MLAGLQPMVPKKAPWVYHEDFVTDQHTQTLCLLYLDTYKKEEP